MSVNRSPDMQDSARQLLGHHNERGGNSPGGFTVSLIQCFEKADPINSWRLSQVFPEMGAVVTIWRQDGPDGLRAFLGEEWDR